MTENIKKSIQTQFFKSNKVSEIVSEPDNLNKKIQFKNTKQLRLRKKRSTLPVSQRDQDDWSISGPTKPIVGTYRYFDSPRAIERKQVVYKNNIKNIVHNLKTKDLMKYVRKNITGAITDRDVFQNNSQVKDLDTIRMLDYGLTKE